MIQALIWAHTPDLTKDWVRCQNVTKLRNFARIWGKKTIWVVRELELFSKKMFKLSLLLLTSFATQWGMLT